MSAENRTSKEQFAELLDEMTSPQQIRPVRRLGEKLRKILADYEIPEEMAEAFGALQRKVFEQHEEIERLQRELREEQERYDELRTGHAKCSPDEPAELPVIPANVTRFRYRDATRDIIESDWGDYVKYRDYVDLRAAYDCATEMNKQQSAKLRPPEPPSELLKAAQDVIKAVDRTHDVRGWFEAIAALKRALEGLSPTKADPPGVPAHLQMLRAAETSEIPGLTEIHGANMIAGGDDHQVRVYFVNADGAEKFHEWLTARVDSVTKPVCLAETVSGNPLSQCAQYPDCICGGPPAETSAPQPACNFGPCLIVDGEEWHDPNCPSLSEGGSHG